MSQKDLACLLLLVLVFGPVLVVNVLSWLDEKKYQKKSADRRRLRAIRNARAEGEQMAWMVNRFIDNVEWDIEQERLELQREADHYQRMNELKAQHEEILQTLGEVDSEIEDILANLQN